MPKNIDNLPKYTPIYPKVSKKIVKMPSNSSIYLINTQKCPKLLSKNGQKLNRVERC